MTAFDVVLGDLDRADLGLRRAWPRAADQLLLDVDDRETGQRIAGQWFADPGAAERVASATSGARAEGRIVRQPDGADRKLPTLDPLLRRPGATLVSHRPERRAVVALDDGARFAKVVPARKVATLRHLGRRAASLPIRTPVLEPTETGAMVVTQALPGVPLSELLTGPRAEEALIAVGAAMARLHRCAPPAGSSLHSPDDEVAVTTGWERWARTYELPLPDVADHPIPRHPATWRVIHRDLHDGQLLLTANPAGGFDADGVGLLDFDLMAAGDPALDLANLVEHLQLRARQGALSDADAAVEALLRGYDPDEDLMSRVAGYRGLTARRLAALYAFRASHLVT